MWREYCFVVCLLTQRAAWQRVDLVTLTLKLFSSGLPGAAEGRPHSSDEEGFTGPLLACGLIDTTLHVVTVLSSLSLSPATAARSQ